MGNFRIAGVNLPVNKHIVIALTHLYGIGRSTSKKILAELGIDPETKVRDLATEQEETIRTHIASMTIEGDLRRKVSMAIKQLKDLKTYRGLRHQRRLPVRGQNTKSNARTRKGRRK
jgi:small subunit ribosomal protein S13